LKYIAVYYYVRIIKFMYLDEPRALNVEPKPLPLQAALIIVLAGVLIVGIYPCPFLSWINLIR